MNESMGQIIRRLRKERDFTQEQLAEQLGVTAQAISKWESEAGMPDISQVVPLAMVFGVPTDVLFGRYGQDDNEEAQKIADEIQNLANRWFNTDEEECEILREQLEHYRKALKTYPNNLTLRMGIVTTAHFLASQGRSILTEEEREELRTESIASAEMVVKYSPSQDQVLNARWWIMNNHLGRHDWDKAKDIAESMPSSLMMLRGMCLADVYHTAGNTEECLKQRCENIATLLSSLEDEVCSLSKHYYNQENYADAAACGAFLRGLFPLIYGDETYVPPFHSNVHHLYFYPAVNMMKLGRPNEALDLLEAGLAYEDEQAKDYNIKETVDVPLLRGCTFRFWGKEYSHQMWSEFEDFKGDFAPLQGNPRFEAFLVDLAKSAPN